MLIGICGGIGCGKSVVSRILRLRGAEVYDCDLEARRIMDESEEILLALNERFGEDVCPIGGPIHRPNLARHVFSDDNHRLWLNSLVHRLVKEDIELWQRERTGEISYVESAIIASSGLAELCDEIWIITASEDERIARVRNRDGMSEQHIRRRMESQKEEERLLHTCGIPLRYIDNSMSSSLLEQLQ